MKTFIATLLALALTALAGCYREDHRPPAAGSGVMCTEEAKLCPDGSYVGRTGPHCEFAPCPR